MFDGWDVLRLLVILTLVCVGTLLVRRVRIRRLRRRQAAGTTLVAVRTVQGEHRWLSTRWQRRLAAPQAGRLDLSRWLVDGRDHVVLEVLAVRPGARDLKTWEQMVTDDVFARVLTVQTPTGELEVAVGCEQAEWLRSRLTPAPAADGS
ncbi:hypothetical protein A7K94_0219345 [Modestobacter sp. VKM Ac-2676]|nr:hypothetical protein A7K94_0219345 [Modestobacter sp. VKM Ac-2676]